MEIEESKSESEVVGIALQRIGELLENGENISVSFDQKRDVTVGRGGVSVQNKTTSMTLEVSGVER